MANSIPKYQSGKHAAQTQHENKGNGGTTTGTPSDAAPNKASNTPIFIDVDTLELTIINGNQEIYHQNCYGRFGCQGSDDDGYDDEDSDDFDDYDFDDCSYCAEEDGDYCGGDDCDDIDADGCTWEDDEFDGDENDRDDGRSSTAETTAAADASIADTTAVADTAADSPHCPNCGFSAECLKTSIESGDNIYIDQIIKELAKIAGVPIGPAIRMMNGYFGLCSIFDEDAVGRFKKSKFDAKRLPAKKSDAMTRIHNAAVTLAYGLGDADKEADDKETDGKAVSDLRTDGREKAADSEAGAVTQTGNNVNTGKTDKVTASKPTVQEKTKEECASVSDLKAFLEDAPEPMKALVNILHKMGGNVRVYKIDLDADVDVEDTSDDVFGTDAAHTGKAAAHTHTSSEVPSHE